MRRAALLIVMCSAGCKLNPPVQKPPPSDGPRLVVAERGPSGARLVVVGEDGARLSNLTAPAEGTVLDVSPAFSPDGRWVAFASTRGRALDAPAVWVVAARAGSEPVRVSEGDAVEMSPAWTADGRALVFASNRDGDFDLWRQGLALDGDAVKASGAAEKLTDLPGQELTPSVAADGRVAFTRREGSGDVRNRIAVRATDGTIDNLTAGPADSGPVWTRDGTGVVFTAPNLRSGDRPGVDGDLWLVSAAGGDASLLLDSPGTSEVAPVFSYDDRWLFATSVVTADSGELVFSSIVFVDRKEASPEVHMLVDPAGANPRVAIAVAPVALDAAVLAAAPLYREQLKAILERAAP